MSVPTKFLDRCKWELEKFEKLSFKSASQLLVKVTKLEQQLADQADKIQGLVKALEKELPDLWEYYPNAARRIEQALTSYKEGK